MSKTKRKGVKTFGRILGGSILESMFTERLFFFLFIIFLLSIFYINNRYVCQWRLIEINQMRSDLKEIKRNARARLSELMGDSRKSLIEDKLKLQESELQISGSSTYVIFDMNGDSANVGDKVE